MRAVGEVVLGVHQLPVAGSSVFLVVENPVAIIDAGGRRSGRRILEELSRLGRRPQDVCYLVATREHLKGLEGPVLFVANHNMRLDNPLIYMALPFGWLWRLCTAAAADDIFGNPVGRIGAPLLGNAFPFAREGAVRTSLEHLGQLLDGGWSVLIYPEGFRSSGEIKPFKAGTGLIAVESRTPVAPIRVIPRKGSVFDGAGLLSRGEVEIRFGKPLTFARQSDYVEATARLEAAVMAL